MLVSTKTDTTLLFTYRFPTMGHLCEGPNNGSMTCWPHRWVIYLQTPMMGQLYADPIVGPARRWSPTVRHKIVGPQRRVTNRMTYMSDNIGAIYPTCSNPNTESATCMSVHFDSPYLTNYGSPDAGSWTVGILRSQRTLIHMHHLHLYHNQHIHICTKISAQ